MKVIKKNYLNIVNNKSPTEMLDFCFAPLRRESYNFSTMNSYSIFLKSNK